MPRPLPPAAFLHELVVDLVEPIDGDKEEVITIIRRAQDQLETYDATEELTVEEGKLCGTRRAGTSRLSYLSPAAHIIRELQKKGADLVHILDIVIICLCAGSMQFPIEILTKFIRDEDPEELPDDLYYHFLTKCLEDHSGWSKGSDRRFRFIADGQWPTTREEVHTARRAVVSAVNMLIGLSSSNNKSTPSEFHQKICKEAQKVKGVGPFRSSITAQLIVLSGLAGEHPRVLEQGRYMEVVRPSGENERATAPYKYCKKKRIDMDTVLQKISQMFVLPSGRKMSLADAEACICEANRSGGVPTELYFRGQRFYDILEDKILVGPEVK